MNTKLSSSIWPSRPESPGFTNCGKNAKKKIESFENVTKMAEVITCRGVRASCLVQGQRAVLPDRPQGHHERLGGTEKFQPLERD